jgi:syntaxin 1B/2/3
MQRLQSNVVKVNEIFRDIANMVEEQSEQVDLIEIHVDDARERTDGALEQLNKAVRRQKVTRRGLAFFLACFLTFVIVCIILAQSPWAG